MMQILKAEGQQAVADLAGFMRDHDLTYCAGQTDGCPQPCRFVMVDREQDELYTLCDDHALAWVARQSVKPKVYHFVDRTGLFFWLANDPSQFQ